MRMDYSSEPTGGPVPTAFNMAMTGQTIEPWLQAAARGGMEVFTLMNQRTQAYMELPMRVSQCRSPQEIAAEQMRFWQIMARQYGESSQRIFGTWLELAQRGRGHSGNGRERERDYISFPESEEDSAGSRRGGHERRAA